MQFVTYRIRWNQIESQFSSRILNCVLEWIFFFFNVAFSKANGNEFNFGLVASIGCLVFLLSVGWGVGWRTCDDPHVA